MVSQMDHATDYRSARANFLAECGRRDLTVTSYQHPKAGPDGDPIFTDVARAGPVGAAKVLVMVSGTHGVEGYGGSNAQVAWLQGFDPRQLPADTSVVLIHMINVWGAAWRRRHNEENIDLNRHFVDRGATVPENKGHAELVCEGLLDSLTAPTPDDALRLLDRFRDRRGADVCGQAVFQGQYDCPEGLGFGGTVPSWSQHTLEAAARAIIGSPREVALIDLHTGLGPFGVGTLISIEPPGAPETTVLRGWYDANFVALLEDQQGLPYKLQGDLAQGLRRALPDARVLAVSLEFGTYEAARFAELMVKDAWAERRGDPNDPEVEAVRCDLMHFFYPNSAKWRAMVDKRTQAVAAMALAGLKGL